MVYIIALMIALTVTFLTASATLAVAGRSRTATRRLSELGSMGQETVQTEERRRRQKLRGQVEDILRLVGERWGPVRQDLGTLKRMLIQAGYRAPSAVATYMGARLALTGTLAVCGLAVALSTGMRMRQALATLACSAVFGWIAPAFYLGRKATQRRKGIQYALPDTLDLLVVCVEAGLGLNQALVRVADEIRHVSRAMSEDLGLVNLEIQAGVERTEALRNLADRTGVDDIRALTAVLIQTDRFGTSIATALRTQADALRTKRRQQAEEAAAKTTIKLVPPLVICIFPAMFAVVLGPAAIQIVKFLSGIQDPAQPPQ